MPHNRVKSQHRKAINIVKINGGQELKILGQHKVLLFPLSV